MNRAPRWTNATVPASDGGKPKAGRAGANPGSSDINTSDSDSVADSDSDADDPGSVANNSPGSDGDLVNDARSDD
jgi:hypothetical protein